MANPERNTQGEEARKAMLPNGAATPIAAAASR